MPQIQVSIGIVFDHGNLLICQRKQEGTFPNLWEFPGGKIEPDASPAQCVCRELREELDIEVEPFKALDVIDHRYPHFVVRLHPFLCRLIRGNPIPVQCQQVRWVRSDQLHQYPFPEANRTLLDKLIAMDLEAF